MKNSFFQTFGAFGITGFNFLLSVGYARFLGPTGYGSLVTSQAQVLIFTLLVDLGLSHSLIGTLTTAEGEKGELSRQGFRARDLLYRVLSLRLLGAILGTFAIMLMTLRENEFGSPQFWQDLAFTPHLFGFTLQQTAISLAMFRHRQGLSVSAYLGGVVLSVIASLGLAWWGAPVSWLLFSQAMGGFVTGGILFGYFGFLSFRKKLRGQTRRQEKNRGNWGKEAWRALAKDAWPYAITAAVFVLWQRLDQLVVSHWIGLEAGGQYALAVRLVGAPVLIASSICFAIFPDLQRVGLDAPERVKIMMGLLLKLIWRYGMIAGAFFLFCLAAVVVPIVPKFLPAVKLLPYFLPGVWAFWMQSFVVNAMFGLREYKAVVKVYLSSFLVFAAALPLLAKLLGLSGVVMSYDIFCFAMLFFVFRAAKACGLLPQSYYPWHSYLASEKNLLKRAFNRRVA